MAERTEGMTAAAAPATTVPGHYVDWAAIFAGAVVATAIGLVFAGFGGALGLSALSAEQGEGSGLWSLILTGIWALVTLIAAYTAGGYIAGRMRRRIDSATSDEVSARDAIHGMVVWALGVIVGLWIAASAVGSVVTAVGSAAGSVAQAAGSVVQGAASAVGGAATAVTSGGLDLSSFNPIDAVNNRLLRGTGEQIDSDLSLSPAVRDVMFSVAQTGELTDADRAILTEEIAANSTFTQEQINARIDQAVSEVTDLRDQAAARIEDAAQLARDAVETARRSAVVTAFIATAAFLIAAVAAMWGAGLGGRHRDEGRLFRGFRSY